MCLANPTLIRKALVLAVARFWVLKALPTGAGWPLSAVL